MRLDVLGACGTFPSRGGACSGYLLRHEGFALWIDAGTGTMSRLQEHIDPADVDAIFLSHMHPDHFVDVYPMFYGLSFHPKRPRRVPLIGPAGLERSIGLLLSSDARDNFAGVFDVRAAKPGDEMHAGPFTMRFFDSVHSSPNLTLRIDADGTALCYSGDTGPNPELVKAAAGADVFLCEASWQRDTDVTFGAIHCRAHETGAAARDAGAGRLLMTHLWPTLDAERSRDEAAEQFGGPIDVAVTGEGTDV